MPAADGIAEADGAAVTRQQDPVKATRDEGGVARDLPPEPAALQEVLALPPPEEPQSGSAAHARGGSRKNGGRKAPRTGSSAGERPDAKVTESKDEAPARAGTGSTERGDTLPEDARDSEWM